MPDQNTDRSTSHTPVIERRLLRQTALQAREALSETERSALTQRLEGALSRVFDELRPTSIAFCWPVRGEPDLRAFVTAWLAAGEGRRVAMPVVLDKHSPLMFRRWHPDCAMRQDQYGIPVPEGTEVFEPALLLVPLNAFDAAGYRLGYGGGYFDRTLAQGRFIAVGVGFELGRVASVMPQPHDLPMDWIVTEAGAFRPARQTILPA